MNSLRLSKSAIEAIPHPDEGQILFRDTTLRGFGLRVGARSKVFFAEGQVNRRTRRVTLGRADVLSVDQARRLALAALCDMATGVDPNVEKRKAAQEGVTLQQAFDRFFAARGALVPSTVDSYSRTRDLYLRDWRRRPLTDITRQMVLKRHRNIAEAHGQVTANNVMRHLRSVYNVTAAAHDEFPPNPVSILTQARAWYPEQRRRRAVAAHQLPAWWEAVMDEPDHSRDYLLIALFTGMRRAEIAGMRWDYVDLEERALHIPRTKNGDPLDLPLSDFLTNLLDARRARAGNNPWVFPSASRTGHITETKTFTRRVSARSGVVFTLHDLRRTV